MKKFFFIVFLFTSLFSVPVYSDTCNPDDDPGAPSDPFCDGNTDVPLDSGLLILIGASTFYCFIKLRVKSDKEPA